MEENQVQDSDVTTANNGLDAEKTFTQSELNNIVQHRVAKAAEAAKRQAEEVHRRELENIQAQSQQHQAARNENVSRETDADALYQQVVERLQSEAQKQQVEREMNNIANSYLTKMQKGKEGYQDFEDVTKGFDPTAYPQLVYLVAGMDNAADVIYDLSKNPMKLAALDNLAMKMPHQARAELERLSGSIAQNKQALTDAESQQVAAPLDRLQPSRVSGSNGKMSISDLRNQPHLRG